MKKLLYFLILFSTFKLSIAQVSVDANQLSQALQDKLMEEITNKITESVQQGEKWVANESYFSIVLEPFEDFGINPTDPNFLNQAYAIHKKIEDEIEKNPGLTRSSLLKGEIQGIVTSGLKNYALSKIDKESIDIYNQTTQLYSAGKDKITQLLNAAEGISDLDPFDSDYESSVTSILKQYAIKSDYFYLIDDLDQVISIGLDKIADPISALSTISSAMGSDDPVHKIEMLFELGESFGGKIPIIGDLITPIFTLGKGVLNAAKGLENILEKNLNQGCINPAGGTYASTNPNRRSKFIKKFPNVSRVCPMSQGMYHPIYNNIFVSEDASTEIFFYLEDVWLRGKKDVNHKGTEDIYAAIQWLRRNGNSDKATDLEFMFTAYQKEYGWSVYTEKLKTKINRIRNLFHYSYLTVNFCEDDKLEEFYLKKLDLGWLKLLLETNGLTCNWEDIKYKTPFDNDDIINSMIKNYYLSKHQDNFAHLDRIIKNLETHMPINIEGTVSEYDGTPIRNAELQVGLNSMFNKGDKNHQIITSGGGYFSYFIIMKFDDNKRITATAVTPDNQVIIEDLDVVAGLKVNVYTVNLSTPFNSQDTTSQTIDSTTTVSIADQISNSDCAKDPNGVAEWDPVNEIVVCSCIDNYKWDEIQKKCIPAVQPLLDNADCASDPHGFAEWDPVNEIVICTCVDNYWWDDAQKKCIPDVQALLDNADCAGVLGATAEWDPVAEQVICKCVDTYHTWDPVNKKCVPNVQAILDNSDCSQWLNTEPKWDYASNEPYCDCIAGYKWNDDYTECLSLQDQLVATTDCSHYPNTQPVWDPVSKEVVCDCLPGYEWDENYTECILKSRAVVQNTDCSMYPNTEPVWDPVSEQAYCDCSPGYEWNENYTGCEKIVLVQQQPQQTQYDCSHLPNSRPVFDPVLKETVCDCLPGYEWNKNYTACIPIPKKPTIDWGSIIDMTVGILDAAAISNSITPSGYGSNLTNSNSTQQPVRHQSNCNDQQQAGGDAPEVHTIDLGQSYGSFVLDYEVYSVKDQIIVTQSGQIIFNSGCISGSNSVSLNLNGFSSQVTVRVNPNCDGSSGTKWNFTVHCPNQ
ncbi:hypothetical protein N9164_13980 [Draconibacterium sp.]|nr:hypothetical protein [Draconibacterium sp.]